MDLGGLWNRGLRPTVQPAMGKTDKVHDHHVRHFAERLGRENGRADHQDRRASKW